MKTPVSAREPEATSGAVDLTPAAAAGPAAAEPTLDPAVTARYVAVGELRRLAGVWLKHEPGARLGQDPEELHQLRVTARRTDATLALFKRQLPASLVGARKTTKGVLRSLGAARDLDVLLSELDRYCAGLPEHERATAEPLRALLESERTRMRARMVRVLDSEATHRWLGTLAQAGAESGEPNGLDRATAVMPERVRRRFRKLRKSVGKLRGKSSMDDYHQVRRRAKQLRYATECGAVMFGKPADDMLKALRRLQDKLGAHQDAYMAQDRLAAIAADPASGLPPATLFLMGRLAEHHARVAAQARQTLARSWRKVRGKRWKALRARLGELRESAGANGVGAHELDAVAHEDVAGAVAGAVPETTAAHAPEGESRPVKH